MFGVKSGEIVAFFSPHAIRRPWGFNLGGYIGLELPGLREWLGSPAAIGAPGIFHTTFTCYHIANDNFLARFQIIEGEAPPADEWVDRIKARVTALPTTVAELIETYTARPEQLGCLVSGWGDEEWKFLLAWHRDPKAARVVPRMLPDGRIVASMSAFG